MLLPDSLRELLRGNVLGIANDVRVVFERDLGIGMSHEARDDVNRVPDSSNWEVTP